ncbi:MAG TPA: hypothetical protein PLS55_14430, partial [Thermogutta sp.]|nr:hypothetical protein [Thermogutta sp.]
MAKMMAGITWDPPSQAKRWGGLTNVTGTVNMLRPPVGILLVFLGISVFLSQAGCRKAPQAPALEEIEALPTETAQTPAPPPVTPVLAPLQPITIRPGESATCTITVDRRGLTGPIAVQVQNLPPGVSASPLEIPDGQSSGELTLTADKSLGENEIAMAATVQIEVAGQKATQS